MLNIARALKKKLLISGMVMLTLAIVFLVIYTLLPPKVGAVKYPVSLTVYPSSSSRLSYLIEIDSEGVINAYKGLRTEMAYKYDESLEIRQYYDIVEASASALLSERDQKALNEALEKIPATPKTRDLIIRNGWYWTLFFNGKAYKLLGDETSGDVYDAVKLIMSLSPLPIVIQGYA